jgi:hypothetical protein
VRDTAVVTVSGGSTSSGGTTIAANPTAPWAVTRNFETGPEGALTERTPSGFDDAAGAAFFSSAQRVGGAFSAKLTADSGATGFGNWGGIVNFPSALRRGDELWLQFYIYFPAGFQITTNTGSLKFIRILTQTEVGGWAGQNDIQLMNDGDPSNSFRVMKEGQDQWFRFGAPSLIKRDQWHRVTTHLVFDSVSAVNGGLSRVRFWLDGRLLTEEKRITTLGGSRDIVKSFFLFTYWNGGAPRTQSLFVDEILMANRVPAWASDLEGMIK